MTLRERTRIKPNGDKEKVKVNGVGSSYLYQPVPPRMKHLNISYMQFRFVQEYVKDYNGTQAAKRAGYAVNSAGVQASNLLAHDKIRAALRIECEAIEKRTEITQDRVLNELGKIAFSDPRQMFEDTGELRPIQDLEDEVAGSVAGIESEDLWEGRGKDRIKTGQLKKVRFWSKEKGLELLGRYFKMFGEDALGGGKPNQTNVMVQVYLPDNRR